MPYYRDDNLLKKFGRNLKKYRKVKNLTQEELSYWADLDISQVGRIERGEVNTSLCVMQRLAKALKVELKDLVNF